MGCTLMSQIEDKAYNLIEEMTLKNCQWSSERYQSKRFGGKFVVNALTLFTAKMDVMAQRIDRLNVNAINGSARFLMIIFGLLII